MDIDLTYSQKSFSKIGWIFFIFSVSVTIIQAVALVPFILSKQDSINITMCVSTGMLYLVGSLVLALSAGKLPVTKIPKRKMTFSELVKAFIMCYAAMIGANMIGIFITALIGAVMGGEIVNPLLEIIPEMSIPLLVILTVLGAPIFEELFFRKYIIDRLLPYGELTALMISGFMFGLFHGNLSQFPYAFVLGAAFGYIYIRTGQIKYPVLLHAAINFMGSIVSGLILKYVDLDLVTKALDSGLQQTDSLLVKTIMHNLDSILIYFLYEAFVLLFIVIGIILWILNFKKIYIKQTEEQIPKGQGVRIALMNKGMIAYTIFWLITIIFASIPE